MNVRDGSMRIDENYRKLPIKFYEKPDGSIYFESKFLNGNAKNINDAFKVFTEQDWYRNLVYYYDDVTDVEFGTFEPALTNRKYKGMKYLGQINLRLDIEPNWGTSEHSITHLLKNPQDRDKQLKYIKQQQDQEKWDKFKSKIKDGIKKVAGMLKHEMFFPEKTRYDLICNHCGEIIPTATYYEEYQGNNYHLECIWDKLYNETNSNDYQDCREFFFSLQQYIGNWPNNLDIQDDYEIDLDFVRMNDRKTGLNEAAAMYKSNQPTFKDYFNYIIKNPKNKASYFEFYNGTLRIDNSAIVHTYNKHNMTAQDWINCVNNFNVINVGIARKTKSGNRVFLCHLKNKKDYGMSLIDHPKYFAISTIFVDHPNSIDNWIKEGSRTQSATQPPGGSRQQNADSVAFAGLDPNNIITYINQKIKG